MKNKKTYSVLFGISSIKWLVKSWRRVVVGVDTIEPLDPSLSIAIKYECMTSIDLKTIKCDKY
jgi:hypothetical protein